MSEAEEWRTIKEFPEFEISSTGAVRHGRSKHIVKPIFGQGSKYEVTLRLTSKRHFTRSVRDLHSVTFPELVV